MFYGKNLFGLDSHSERLAFVVEVGPTKGGECEGRNHHIDSEEGPVVCVLSFLDVVSRQVRRIGREGYPEGVVQVGHSRRVTRATKLDLAKPKKTSGSGDARGKEMGGGDGGLREGGEEVGRSVGG